MITLVRGEFMLELIAMLSMLIDHTGYLFFSEYPIFRIIGRIAFPLYMYGVFVGYQHTSSIKKYYIRLVSLALLSQIPYTLAFNTFKPNAIFTILAALLVLTILDKFKYYLSIPLIILISIVAEFYLEYGVYGILMIIVFKYAPKKWLLLPFIAINLVWYYVLDHYYLQLYSILCIIILSFQTSMPNIKINRTFYRLFYPVHLLILWIAYYYLS
jgi:hypothetical protein